MGMMNLNWREFNKQVQNYERECKLNCVKLQ